jgi:hypothetical protein
MYVCMYACTSISVCIYIYINNYKHIYKHIRPRIHVPSQFTIRPIRGMSTTPGIFPTVCGRSGAKGSPQTPNIAAAWGHFCLNPRMEAPIVWLPIVCRDIPQIHEININQCNAQNFGLVWWRFNASWKVILRVLVLMSRRWNSYRVTHVLGNTSSCLWQWLLTHTLLQPLKDALLRNEIGLE